MSIKSRILQFMALRQNVIVGNGFHIGPWSTVWAPYELRIGNDVYVGKHVTIEVDGIIGDQVLIANNVGIVGKNDHNLSAVGQAIRSAPWVGDHLDQSTPVHIGSDVWVGFGAIILSGVSIGNSSIIGAGAIVTSDIPENSIAIGSPARVVANRFNPDEWRRHWELLSARGVVRLER